MNKHNDRPDESAPDLPDADAILTRRNFLIQAALASAGLSLAGAIACEDTEPEPQPCLSQDVQADADTGQPEVCLSADVQPEACLSPPYDANDVADSDMPQPCLSPPIDDVSDSSDTPQICLSPALDTTDDGDV